MLKSELIKRSPLRIFENSIHGGVGAGNLGVIASKKGVGKTGCLVHIATDKLFCEKHVIHVSFSSRVDHIHNWYEDIFSEIAKKRNLENAAEVHDEIVKNRVIMNFSQTGKEVGHVISSLQAMMQQGHFPADVIIVDGFDIEHAEPGDIAAFKAFAEESKLEIWFSLSVDEEALGDGRSTPKGLESYMKDIAVMITLRYEQDYIAFQVVKDHDNEELNQMNLKLDQKTLLIAEH